MSLSLKKLSAQLVRLCLFVIVLITSQASLALVGGTAANPSDYPGQVVLSYDSTTTSLQFQNCSGIVLDQRRILTSLSCVYSLGTGGYSPIPASEIYVHPVENGEIGGRFIIPPVAPSLTPNARVSTYVVHPQSSGGSGPYNLAILYLASNINLPQATIYNGTDHFIDESATALGWLEEKRDGTLLSTYYYVLNQLSFDLVEGNTDFDGTCYDNFVYTGTVFCGGFRNASNFLEYPQDEGMPIYRSINGVQTVIGLLSNASHGILFDGEYLFEKYARISSMVNFIQQHAPNTLFRNESSDQPDPEFSLIPLLQLLLLDD